MGLIFLDSFDHYDGVDLFGKWTLTSTGQNLNRAAGRHGFGLNIFSTAGNPKKTFPQTYTKMTAGVAYKSPVFSNSIIIFSNAFLLRSGATTPQTAFSVSLTNVGDGRLYVKCLPWSIPATTIVSSPSTFTMNVNEWYYIEFSIEVSVSSVDYIVRINEEVILSGTLDIPDTVLLEASVNAIELQGPGGGSLAVIDDLYITEDEFLGDITIGVIRPDGVGLSAGWTPSDVLQQNWELTNDINPDGDTTYVSALEINTSDLYDMEDISLPAGAVIKGIQGLVCVKKSDTGLGIVKPQYECDGNSWDGEEFYASYNSYLYARDAFRLNPGTGLDFTEEEINAIHFGQIKVNDKDA